jgi:hypothetical protein
MQRIIGFNPFFDGYELVNGNVWSVMGDEWWVMSDGWWVQAIPWIEIKKYIRDSELDTWN